MPSPLKKSKSNEKNTNQSLHNAIYTKVTAENYQKNQDETAKECKKLFKDEKDPADPKVLTQLEEILRERQDEQALAKHLELSKPGTSPGALAELKKSVGKKREHYNNYTQHFLPALLGKITQSKELDKEKVKEIGRIISEITSKSSDKDHSSSAIQGQNGRRNSQISSIERSSNNESDSGIGSRELSATSTSSEESLNSIPSVAEENNGLQPEDEEGETKLAHLTKTRSKGPSGRRSPSKYNKKIEDQGQSKQTAEEKLKTQENENSDGQEGKISSQVKRELKSNGKESGPALLEEEEPKLEEQKKEAVLSKQEASNNQNNSEDIPLKQPNNRNLHVALVAGCALSTIGCIVAGAMTLGLVGAGLLAMAAVFAIAAVAELHSNFLSSKLTSINVSPLVDDKELTACSQR